MYIFQALAEVREQADRWLKEYNEERPHEFLGNMTPREFLLTHNKSLLMAGTNQGRVTFVGDFLD
jgi:putative transposase